MPFTAEQIGYATRHAINYHLENEPIDNVNVDRPLIKKLMSKLQEYAGGLQYVTEQLRYSNDSNFQSYFGDQQVTYNRKRTLEQSKFTWGSFHDGFGLNEDELTQNGIIMTDDRSAVPSDAEKVQLSNLLEENSQTLKLGFQEGMDLMLHRDGTQSATDIPGLDHVIALDPTIGVVGGIDAATNAWWRNYAKLNIDTATPGTLIQEMEVAWRRCIRLGGQLPDFILMGGKFLDAYRKDAKSEIDRQIIVQGKKGVMMDAAVGNGVETGLFFKGVPIIWDPVFELLDNLDAPAQEWEKRCYFINTRHLKLRPIKGHWMVPRKPPRVYDRYVHYSALTAKAAFTTGKRAAHAVLTIQ